MDNELNQYSISQIFNKYYGDKYNEEIFIKTYNYYKNSTTTNKYFVNKSETKDFKSSIGEKSINDNSKNKINPNVKNDLNNPKIKIILSFLKNIVGSNEKIENYKLIILILMELYELKIKKIESKNISKTKGEIDTVEYSEKDTKLPTIGSFNDYLDNYSFNIGAANKFVCEICNNLLRITFIQTRRGDESDKLKVICTKDPTHKNSINAFSKKKNNK